MINEKNAENYIDRIKRLKNEKKITNEQLSELTGIPLSTMSKLLAGISEQPKLINVVAIARALGCSLDYLVNGDGECDHESGNRYILAPDEAAVMEDFRSLDTHGKELVTMVIHKEKAAKPSLAASVVDINPATLAVTGDENILVRYHSIVQAGAVCEAKYGAQITGYTMRHNATTYTTSPVTIEGVESGSFSFAATDSRGYVTELVQNKTVIPYIKLSCNFAESPMDADGNMQIKLWGSCFTGSFGAVNNEITVEYRYRTANSSYGEWLPMPVTVGNNSYTAQIDLTGLNYRVAHTFQARVTDKLESAQSANYKVRVIPIFDWGEEDFNINGTLKINNVAMADHIVEQGTSTDWSYRKWASGAAEVWGTLSFQSGTWSGANNLYYITKNIKLPESLFTQTPRVLLTVSTAGGAAVTPATVKPVKKTEFQTIFARFYGGTNDVLMEVTVYGYGRWK